MKKHIYEALIVNCKLAANSSMKRDQKHQVEADSENEARQLVSEKFSHLFSASTFVSKITLVV